MENLRQQYGATNVAWVGHLCRRPSRKAVYDVTRILGYSFEQCGSFADMLPRNLPRLISIDEALEQFPDLKRTYETDLKVREVLDLARRIEGLPHFIGPHAATVVIGNRLAERIPLFRSRYSSELVTQWPAGALESWLRCQDT